MNTKPMRLLFLCTGNSCRSIMAEAITNHYSNGRYLAFSAGSVPTGRVHPKAIEMLANHGIKPNAPRSKSWNEFKSESIDLVITVCDQAAHESCPIFPGHPKKLHWSIPDPAKVKGSEMQINTAFEDVFIQLKQWIEKELLA
ncbi:Low molecular weight protein-tyrosine-phosphatase YwlE [Legionella sainthelensi]|uniref:Low molecular weight protein-tyrosine-phosphatase YwlE n=1 Tax=Legionella sainthelensi TaxID=28087 RepID=A0A0W0YDY2_9GAMM|nr:MULTISPECIES: arsenate reductase ArsC [Legionella]KTD55160.1 Low molecular weight protein-tyrosine-phosphatase YwlE [Legionella sainthelensi]MCE3045636.1 arsenate reductase ArsC [Legionella sp. 16cNR16C]MCZ4683647.1 arsenate reductase ArsC [Legionella pneumophila]VEH36796.1 Protein-tyrosine-phosphatase [Legionella sainthelensi]HAU1161681.1 arsenate reductase ArsC [Legionella pneumophila]